MENSIGRFINKVFSGDFGKIGESINNMIEAGLIDGETEFDEALKEVEILVQQRIVVVQDGVLKPATTMK